MALNENIGRAIAKFDKTLRKAGFSFDAERKIMSILRSMVYQVELGDYPPISVMQHSTFAGGNSVVDHGRWARS
jgi:hypothetical protein